ncbi:reverse transcriptase domain-containing protein [Tanacetum coccineum]
MENSLIGTRVRYARNSHHDSSDFTCPSDTSCYLNKLAPSVGPTIFSTKEVEDGGSGRRGKSERPRGDPSSFDKGVDRRSWAQDYNIAKGKEVVDEDLGKPFKEARRTPLTHRIIEFAGPEYKIPTNIKLYDGTADSEDHLSRFASAANLGEWPMLVSCRMFQQTLHGSARGWFERLPQDNINEWAELREAFAARYSVRRACFKEPYEITKIVRKANESLTAFKERWTMETCFIMGVLEVMKISSFMDSEAYGSTELPKREAADAHCKMSLSFNRRDNRSFRNTHPGESRRNDYRSNYRGRDMHLANRIRDDRALYLPRRGEPNHRVASVLTLDSLTKHPKEILATETQLHLPAPRPMLNPLRKQLEMALESGELNHLVKDVRQRGRGSRGRDAPQPAKIINVISVNSVKDKKRKVREATESWMNVPISFLANSSEDMFEEPLIVEAEVEGYLNKGPVERNPYGLGRVRWGNIKATGENRVGGRLGLKPLRAIPSTIHSMMKFPTPKGVATLVTRTIIIVECRRLEKKQMIEESSRGEKEVAATEEVLVNPSFPDQRVTIGEGLSETCREQLKCLTVRYNGHAPSDYRTHIEACPKDYYPLPNIYCKVESVMGFKYKCFLAAYKGYYQIQMAEEDEEKMAFYTDQETNLEAYVDDMVVKSKDEKMLLANVAETFNNLKKINMKLNPKKCSFGVKEGKFLGYMVTSEGIKANPKNTKALADLQSSRTLKEMQSLSGKLAALNRFLVKSAERSLPFFNTLKNITKENKHEYRWTKEAEEAFQQIKKLIMDLLSLTPPQEKETLYAYLAVSTKALSAVLLTDRKGRQCPVQYVSMKLNKAERNYTPMEKLVLSLIHMTRRLRMYFEAHPVKVITYQPIKNILNNTKASEKLVKCAIKLGVYNITYVPQNYVKGHVLADFLSEAPEGEKEESYFRMPEVPLKKDDIEIWTLFTDRVSSPKGSGAGLVFIRPRGIEYTYAICLTFPSTNNEAEYEALLVGLRIARQMSISNIEVKMDSKLVASQINGSYEASKDSMIKYLAKAKEYASGFKSFSIENIPRNMNQKADMLSKLASVAFNHLTKDVLVEVLNERSTKGQEVHAIMEEEVGHGHPGTITTGKRMCQVCNRGNRLFHQMDKGQATGKDHRANRSLMEGIKTRLERERAGWVKELSNVLWAHRTSIKQSNGETPFTLTYGNEAVIPAEIGIPNYQILMIREGYNEDEISLNLDLLQERRETAAIREARYKTKMEQYYNKKVRLSGFRSGEFVFRRNEASRVEDHGKLGPKWEGPL